MPKFNDIQNAFSYGQVSQKLFGREDLKEYAQGCKRVENMIVQSFGGAQRRPGTVFLHDLELTSDPIVLPFKDKTGSYQIVITTLADAINTDHQMRIYKTSENEFMPLDASTTVSVTIDFTLDPHGYSVAQIDQFLIVVHDSGLVPPRVIIHDGTWGIVNLLELSQKYPQFNSALIMPYKVENTNTDKTMTLSSVLDISGYRTLTSSFSAFTSDSIGKQYIISSGSSDIPVIVKSYTDAQNVQVLNLLDVANVYPARYPGFIFDAAVVSWKEGSWGTDNYPRTVDYYGRRLIFGGAPDAGDTLWSSKQLNFFIFMTIKLVQDETDDTSTLNYYGEQVDEDPITAFIGYSEYDNIKWLQGGVEFFIGTDLGEFVVAGGTWQATTPPGSVQHTSVGSLSYNSALVDNLAIFVDKTGVKLNGMLYSDTRAGYIQQGLSSLSPDLLVYESVRKFASFQRIKKMQFDNSRKLLWILDSFDKLFALTIDTSSNVLAWQSVDVGADVVNFIVSEDLQTKDMLMLTVKREGKYFYERLPLDFLSSELGEYIPEVPGQLRDALIPFFSDSATYQVSSPGFPTDTWSVAHLADQAVSGLLDGIVFEGTVASDGTLTTTASGEVLVVGVPYSSVLETNPLSTNGYFGQTIGSIQRIHEVVANLYNTWFVRIGKKVNKADKLYPAKIEEDFTGAHSIKVTGGFNRGETAIFETDKPLPFGIASVVLKGTANE